MTATKEEDPDFKKILAFVLKAKGFDGRQYKPNYIKRRIAVRMRATGSGTYQDYLKILESAATEATQLLDRLTIHVTEFFRDAGVYKALQERQLQALPEAADKKIKVWCAGCSTGEEAYSVAIMLWEWCFARPDASFEILATDIDHASVRTAEKGEYGMEALQKMPKSQVTRWFHLEGQKAKVVSDLQKNIRFRVHNLLAPWPPELSGFHIVFCRNLLIYLTAPQQQKIYEQFAKALLPGGNLVLGLTETLLGPARRFYQCQDVKHRIYQVLRRPLPAPEPLGPEDGPHG